jgi:competence protein ComEC
MPLHDRSIDLIIATHPHTDHIGGIPELLRTYDVSYLMEPGLAVDNAAYRQVEALVEELPVEVVIARRGMVVHLDDEVWLLIHFPDRDVDGWDPDPASIITQLIYRNTSFMFTGDARKSIEEYIVALEGAVLASEVLKLGHHGSRTSTSPQNSHDSSNSSEKKYGSCQSPQ